MGTSCGWNGRAWVLDCSDCGRVGEVKRRPCPSGYCPSAQLCGPCFAAEKMSGAWAQHHADCERSHRRYMAEQAEKAAHPADWARSARGDWAPEVPTGMVEVTTHAGTVVLIPSEKYAPNVAGFGQ